MLTFAVGLPLRLIALSNHQWSARPHERGATWPRRQGLPAGTFAGTALFPLTAVSEGACARASTSERAEGEILKDPKCFAREKFFSDDARRVSAVDDEF